jgi:hypothetical protein
MRAVNAWFTRRAFRKSDSWLISADCVLMFFSFRSICIRYLPQFVC